MADRISPDPVAAPVLPDPLERLLLDALGDTFDLGRTPPLPDLQLGYQRLVHHLRLLDGFTLPAFPAIPAQVWLASLHGDPHEGGVFSPRPPELDVVGQDDGGIAVSYGPPEPGLSSPSGSDSSKAATGCGILVLLIILIDVIQAFVQCLGQLANGNTCTFWENMLLSKAWEQDPPDPRDPLVPENPDVTAAGLSVIATTPAATQLVGLLFDAHSQAWEAMDRARVFLAVTGLRYPGELLQMPVYAQFTAIPSRRSYPRREEAEAERTYHLPPVSPAENPTTEPSPFAPGARPDAPFLPGGHATASGLSMRLWRQVAAGDQDSGNLDLDGDRGSAHACWSAGGSVHDDPVDVLTLPYDEQ